MITIRCSSLTLAMACPASVLDGGLRVDPVNEAGNVGSAAHEALRALVETGAVEWERIGEIAANHGADEQEVRMLCAQGTRLWRGIAGSFPAAVTEHGMYADLTDDHREFSPEVALVGHIDVLSPSTGAVLDWKTARVDHDYREQMLGYAALVLLDNDALDEVRATVAWVRDGEIEHHTLRRADLAGWIDRLTTALCGWNGEYHPGPQCTFCPRAHDCPAAHALVRRDAAALLDAAEPSLDLSTMEPARILALHERASSIARVADRVKDAIKAEGQARGPIDDGTHRLEIATSEKRELDPAAAWAVLESEGFTDDDFAAVVKLPVGAVEDRVAKKAGRGKGAGAVRALADKLEAAGAVHRRPSESLKLKRSA